MTVVGLRHVVLAPLGLLRQVLCRYVACDLRVLLMNRLLVVLWVLRVTVALIFLSLF